MSNAHKPWPIIPGYGFIVLMIKYPRHRAQIMILLHQYLGKLLDEQPLVYESHPVPLKKEDIRAIYRLLLHELYETEILEGSLDWGVDSNHPINSITTASLCRWAYNRGLIEKQEMEPTIRFMRMA